MIDASHLRAWIQPQHLEEAAFRAHQEAFAGQPTRAIVLKDFLVDAVARRLAAFLSSEAQFKADFGLYSAPDRTVPEKEWLAADDSNRFFRFGHLVGSRPEFAMSPNALTYIRFRQAFQDGRFRTLFEQVTGLALGTSNDFGAHAMGIGDLLRVHNDDNRNRRVAVVIYLTPGWEPRFGGALHLVTHSGEMTRVDALFNSMIVFDVKAETDHYVGAIEPAADGRIRYTIGGWYPNP